MFDIYKIDDKIIEWTQAAYLWFWDRTGVYVGTLMFSSIVADIVLVRHADLKWLDFLLVTYGAVFCGWRYAAQGKDLRQLNGLQRDWMNNWLRRNFIWTINIVFLVAHTIELKPWFISSDLFAFIWTYIACVQVRDRKPPEKLVLAKAGRRT